MATLFTLTFQGQVDLLGTAGAEEEREIARQAFPLALPRDAAVRDGFRAWKTAPLKSDRLLVSVVRNRGDKDTYDRPVLRARGCLLATEELVGPARDLSAVWTALDHEDITDGTALLQQVETLSAQSSDVAFARVHAELKRASAFFAQLAGVLGGDQNVDLYLGPAEHTPEPLRPALALLPLSRLRRLHLAIGTESSAYREPILGFAGSAPEAEKKSFLGGLFKKDQGEGGAVVDVPGQEVRGLHGEGPRSLVEAIIEPHPWPDGLEGIERYRALLECLDAAALGAPKTLFEARPELEELRRVVRRLEALDEDLQEWR